MSYLGWIGNLFIVAGAWGVGNKWRPAFLFTIAGEAIWIAHALMREQYDLAAICVVFAVLAARSWWQWRPKLQVFPTDHIASRETVLANYEHQKAATERAMAERESLLERVSHQRLRIREPIAENAP